MNILLLGLGNSQIREKFVSNHSENYVSRNMLGHEIITFGYNEGVDIKIRPEDEFQEVMKGLPEGWTPDFCMLWEVEWNLLPRGIESAPFPTIAFVYDPDYDIPLARACVESVDLTIALAEHEKDVLYSIGAENVQVFYYIGIIEEFFASNPQKIKDRKYDVLYTTWINDLEYPDRSPWILKLCSLSDKYHVLIESHLSSYEEYISLLNNSKLVFSYNRFGSMSGRVIEAGAQGTVAIEPGCEIKRHFEPHREYIPVTLENIAEQIERYLKNEGALQSMSDQVYSKVIDNYGARDRFLKLLAFIDLQIKREKLGSDKQKRKLNRISESERYTQKGEVYFYSFFRTAPGLFIMNTGRSLIKLSIRELERAVEVERTPRNITNLAIALAVYEFMDGNEMSVKGRLQNAINLLNEVIAAHPSYAMAYFNLGLIHMRVRNYQEAISVFEAALNVFEVPQSDIDPWCLHNRDVEIFNILIRKSLNQNLLLIFRGERDQAIRNIRTLYRAAIRFFISFIEDEQGNIYESLTSLLKSCELQPDSGLIALNAARKLYLWGRKEECLAMYATTVKMVPLDLRIRNEYLTVLHSYESRDKISHEIEGIVKIVKTVATLKWSISELSVFIELNNSSPYSYNPCKEKLLYSAARLLYAYLEKDPQNLNTILRVIEIWFELGRLDRIIELLEEYLLHHFHKTTMDHAGYTRIRAIYEKLWQACQMKNKTLQEKLDTVNNYFDTLQNVTQ
ncbi:MAG: tetratricopeptide repeat protein [Candidatus Brocadia sp.]|nr:tetratricopeptide repeat protein [Candidatus Brocadia sp.]